MQRLDPRLAKEIQGLSELQGLCITYICTGFNSLQQ